MPAIERLTVAASVSKTPRHSTERSLSYPSVKSVQISVSAGYVHESGRFPRGDVTLPVVANLSTAQFFVVTYTQIQTFYLPAPFQHHCIAYPMSANASRYPYIDSRAHCVAACVRGQLDKEGIPADYLLTKEAILHLRLQQRKSRFIPPNEERVAALEMQCSRNCHLACETNVFYTRLAESSGFWNDSSGSAHSFEVSTRFENPVTIVKFVPRLDFQAYIIYVASVFGIWFSASIYHASLDLGSNLEAAFRFLLQLKH